MKLDIGLFSEIVRVNEDFTKKESYAHLASSGKFSYVLPVKQIAFMNFTVIRFCIYTFIRYMKNLTVKVLFVSKYLRLLYFLFSLFWTLFNPKISGIIILIITTIIIVY